jgi:nitrite reductase/ring-hydroxylating ferredoxin subunit
MRLHVYKCNCIYVPAETDAALVHGADWATGRSPRKMRNMKHEICKLADIPTEGSIVIPFFGREAHVYRTEGRARAVANICLHFGGPLDCKEGKFVCPWPGATYDMATGAREAGPAPKSSRLMFLSTREEDDALLYVWGE